MALPAFYLHLLDTVSQEPELSVWKLMRFQHETLPEYNDTINDLKAKDLISVAKDGKVERLFYRLTIR
jgi:hypothetical protein